MFSWLRGEVKVQQGQTRLLIKTIKNLNTKNHTQIKVTTVFLSLTLMCGEGNDNQKSILVMMIFIADR